MYIQPKHDIVFDTRLVVFKLSCLVSHCIHFSGIIFKNQQCILLGILIHVYNVTKWFSNFTFLLMIFFSLFFHLWRIFLIIVKNTFCKHVFLEDHFVFWILKMIPEKCFTLTIQCTVYTVHTPKFGVNVNFSKHKYSDWINLTSCWTWNPGD